MIAINKYFSALLLSAALVSCSNNNNKSITDIIYPVTVFSGKSKTVTLDDMFYSENYDLRFEKNSKINISPNKEKNEITFSAPQNFAGMTSVNFQLDGSKYSIPVLVKKQNLHKFALQVSKKYKELSVFGDFNDWNRKQYFLEDRDGDNVFEVDIPLEPGIYQYKFFADGKEFTDPANPDSIDNGIGGFNSALNIPADPNGNIFLHQLGFQEKENKFVYNFYFEGNPDLILKKENVSAFIDNQSLEPENIEIDRNRVSLKVGKEFLEGDKLIRAAVSAGGYTTNVQMVFVNNGLPANNNSNFKWFDAVIYSLLIDRFSDGDASNDKPIEQDSLFRKANYQGGDLQGVIDKIEDGYFSELGINTIWISPVYDNPEKAYRESPEPHRWYSGYHGYWPVSNTKVESRFGNMEILKELVNKAHKKGIKVLLDFVSNHVHIENPLFKEHRNWFGKLRLPDGRLNIRFWDEFRLTTWFEPYMPSFDYIGSKEAVNFMTDNAVWWLKTTGADGFRHDAVKHVPNLFWRSLTKKLKNQIDSQRELPTFQIGETFGSYDLVGSYVNNGQLSGQFNFNLYNTAQAAFIDPEFSFADLDKELKKTRDVYGAIHYMGNIMDSHDKNRYMAYADGDLNLSQWSAGEIGWNNPPKVDNPSSYDKAGLYYAYMMSIPGIPVIYYGSEFGMTGASDPDNRRMMRFGDELNENEKKMLANTKRLIALRNEHTALRYGDYYAVRADTNVFSFVRSDMNERILAVLNKAEKPAQVNIRLPKFYGAEKITDLATNESIGRKSGKFNININPISWRYFKIN